MTKKVFNPADIAALAAGATLSAQTQEKPELTEAEKQAAAAAEAEAAKGKTEAEAAAAAAATKEAEEAAAAEAAAKGGNGGKEADADKGVVTFLQAQVKEKDSQILALNLEAAKLKDKITESEATFKSLVDIAIKSASNMAVACGGATPNFEGRTPTQILAEHDRLSKEFANKYPVGGVAATDAEASATAQGEGADPLYLARVNATRVK